MRIVFTLLLFLLSSAGIGQTGMPGQVKALFDDAPNGFQKYTGDKKPGNIDSTSTVYSSKIIIVGTFDIDIFKDSSGYIYSALVSDWVSKKEAQKIVEDWISELKESFRSFKKEKRNGFQRTAITAYEFRQEKSSISIDVVMSANNATKAIVVIHISYYP